MRWHILVIGQAKLAFAKEGRMRARPSSVFSADQRSPYSRLLFMIIHLAYGCGTIAVELPDADPTAEPPHSAYRRVCCAWLRVGG